MKRKRRCPWLYRACIVRGHALIKPVRLGIKKAQGRAPKGGASLFCKETGTGRGNRVTGILLVDKPQGFTSFDVVAKVRGMARERRMGHAGTLDPMATGVLPLFLGEATKACDILPCHDKRYTATLRLGLITDTQDSTGKTLEERPVGACRSDVERMLERFVGDLMQVPPMYSAVQVDGRRLYDLAREGKTVERPARPVTVYAAKLLQADEQAHEYTLDVRCSRGTYIRTLCHDIGEALGCGAALTALRRTEAAGWVEAQCHTLEELQTAVDNGAFAQLLQPLEQAFSPLPRVEMDARRARLFCNGVRLDLSRNPLPHLDGRYSVYGPGGTFLGVAHNDYERGELRMDQLFAKGGVG